MKGGMTGLLKVGEDINSVWENDRLWMIVKVNKICFYLMWWGDMKWEEETKACLEWWAREIVTQWNLEGNREGLLKGEMLLSRHEKSLDRSSRFNGRQKRLWQKERTEVASTVSHGLRLWRRGERRKDSRLLGQSAAPAAVAGAERARAECVWERRLRVCSLRQTFVEYLAQHLEMYCLALICDHHLQVYLHMLSTSWEVLSGTAVAERLGMIVQPHLLSESVLSYVNKLPCSRTSPGNKYWLL